MEEKSAGILLQTIPYLGSKKILKVFMPEEGLASLIVHAAKPVWTPLTSPFCIAEWVYRKSPTKELHSLKDGTLLDGLLDLRKNYETLSAAGQIAQDLLRSQLPGKKAAPLYDLFCAYLKKLGQFHVPQTLAASFRLKLLHYEGLLSLQAHCSRCAAPARHLHQGESYCLSHAPYPGFTFTEEEWDHLQTLAFARQFSALQDLPLLPHGKIGTLFDERLS